jgi:hypothetical protein
LKFNGRQIDSDSLFGVQYLVVDAAYVGPDGTVVARDSARVAVRPSVAYPLQNGFAEVSEIRLDELLKNAPRHAVPGSYMRLQVSHDPAQYQGNVDESVSVRMIDRSRLRVTPRLDLLTGLTYFAEVAERTAERRGIPSGIGSDTLVHYNQKENWKLNFFDVTGGAAASIDFEWLRANFSPTPLRLRVGLLAVSDPFETERKRKLGLALLYPIEIIDFKGVASFSVSVGYGKLLGGRDFGVIAPGVGFRIPGL